MPGTVLAAAPRVTGRIDVARSRRAGGPSDVVLDSPTVTFGLNGQYDQLSFDLPGRSNGTAIVTGTRVSGTGRSEYLTRFEDGTEPRRVTVPVSGLESVTFDAPDRFVLGDAFLSWTEGSSRTPADDSRVTPSAASPDRIRIADPRASADGSSPGPSEPTDRPEPTTTPDAPAASPKDGSQPATPTG